MDKINEIFSKLENRQITFEQARKMVLDIIPKEQSSSFKMNPYELHFRHMSENGQLQKENKELVAFIEEERDFWDWFEDDIGETRKEVWERYEKFRDERDGVVKENELVSD